jgi:hypothetical protein
LADQGARAAQSPGAGADSNLFVVGTWAANGMGGQDFNVVAEVAVGRAGLMRSQEGQNADAPLPAGEPSPAAGPNLETYLGVQVGMTDLDQIIFTADGPTAWPDTRPMARARVETPAFDVAAFDVGATSDYAPAPLSAYEPPIHLMASVAVSPDLVW